MAKETFTREKPHVSKIAIGSGGCLIIILFVAGVIYPLTTGTDATPEPTATSAAQSDAGPIIVTDDDDVADDATIEATPLPVLVDAPYMEPLPECLDARGRGDVIIEDLRVQFADCEVSANQPFAVLEQCEPETTAVAIPNFLTFEQKDDDGTAVAIPSFLRMPPRGSKGECFVPLPGDNAENLDFVIAFDEGGATVACYYVQSNTGAWELVCVENEDQTPIVQIPPCEPGGTPESNVNILVAPRNATADSFFDIILEPNVTADSFFDIIVEPNATEDSFFDITFRIRLQGGEECVEVLESNGAVPNDATVLLVGTGDGGTLPNGPTDFVPLKCYMNGLFGQIEIDCHKPHLDPTAVPEPTAQPTAKPTTQPEPTERPTDVPEPTPTPTPDSTGG